MPGRGTGLVIFDEPRKRRRSRNIGADRAAANRLLGLIDDPNAHGKHAMSPRGRVTCRDRQYKWGYAPCQLVGHCEHSYVTAVYNAITADNSYRCDTCKDFVRPTGDGKFKTI